jgi:hypothetical protein
MARILAVLCPAVYDTYGYMIDENYLEKLKERAKESHVYRDFQMTGLEVAQILDDQSHKSLYIGLAKRMSSQTLIMIAKTVAENKNVTNRGAYFMKVLKEKGLFAAARPKAVAPRKSAKKAAKKAAPPKANASPAAGSRKSQEEANEK